MYSNFENDYNHIRSGGSGFYEQERGLIAVLGKEAVQFLDGLISNDVKTLEDGAQILAAFPNAQGRLLAVVRVLRQGERFLFETEEATREKVFNNLFRFTYAGDFFVEDVSSEYRYIEFFGDKLRIPSEHFSTFFYGASVGYFIPAKSAEGFIKGLPVPNTYAVEISDELYEVLRIENGVPKYGVDMDETTIVPELGIDGLISYKKGCYIGQEIIARIYFRGHVAKQLTGLILSEQGAVATAFKPNAELQTDDGKNGGRITSVTVSPKLNKTIGLAFVRYDYLAEGTELNANGQKVIVANLPFID